MSVDQGLRAGNGPDEQQDTEEVENYLENYRIIADWIRFADAKAAAVLTVSAALAGLLIPTYGRYVGGDGVDMSDTHPWFFVVSTLFIGWLSLLVITGLYAFTCIAPFKRKGRHPSLGVAQHFHPAAIAAEYPLDDFERFVQDCQEQGMAGLKKQILVTILIDSHISNRKYSKVTRSIRLLGLSVILALLYLLAIQVPASV
ncbi:MAG: hypothetical protein ACFCD0_22895 [Gemmataceae bacterium]